MIEEKIIEQMQKNEKAFSKYATKSKEAIRLKEEEKDIRLDFARDADRILHTLTYTRYIDKTQVYSDITNDHISKRMTHVQFVSKTSRTIARALGLNEDLCEAISLGHDVGHTPFGHNGEYILSDISKKVLSKSFAHNLNSVRVLKDLENFGKGCNLTLQVLDGIMCHNGELVMSKYAPVKKDINIFLQEYDLCMQDEKNIKKLRPMTLEGCVVRVSDIIGYIGKDIEDAQKLGKIDTKQIPKNITKRLGTTNAQIMNNIIMDVIKNSFNKPYIEMSPEVYKAVVDLKKFNMEEIYKKSVTEEQINLYKKMFNNLYDVYIDALKNRNYKNDIYLFFNNMCNEYKNNTKIEQVVIDFISGMTDRYIELQYNKYILKR
ncbi:MAG: HD domain-containing protein [Clostridia bacterium]|nr:HD domain-containing protein [Clostridia bacterium]